MRGRRIPSADKNHNWMPISCEGELKQAAVLGAFMPMMLLFIVAYSCEVDLEQAAVFRGFHAKDAARIR